MLQFFHRRFSAPLDGVRECLELERRRVFRLVQAEFTAVRQMDRRRQPPRRFRDRAALNAFIGKLFDRGLQVVTHQIQFVMRLFILFCRMRGQLGGRRGKDEPAVAGVDRLEAEHVAQKSADLVGVW